jgi:hypothetical protein
VVTPASYDAPRACGPHDLAPTLDMINLVFRTQPGSGVPHAPSIGWDYTHVYNPGNLDNVRIVCQRGRPVSAVGIYPTQVRTPRGTIGVGGINCVGTHPDHRRFGLSTLLLEDCHTKMRADGLHIGLLGTGISNFYRKLGWERAGRQRTFTLDRRNVVYLPEDADLEITDDWQPYVEQLCALHNADGVGAARDPALFERLALRKTSQIFVGRRRSGVVAYAALSGAQVREYAGEASDVAGLLRRVFQTIESLPEHSTDRSGRQGGQYEMTVLTPATGGGQPGGADTPGLPEILLELGAPATIGYQGMIKILDPVGLFETLGIRAELEPRSEGWNLRIAGGTVEMTEGELVKLVFGPERRPDLAPDAFPVEFFQWPMERV